MDAVSLEKILITIKLDRRPIRPPNYVAENRALVALAECMAQDPQQLPQQLTDLAVELCSAGSAGISLLQQDADGEFFHWIALSGIFAPYVGGRTPRHFSPCGTTLDANAPQLFHCPGRLFTYLDDVTWPIVEGLVIPFALDGCAAGTIWITGHHPQQQFDAEDVRLMTTLARFTGAALQTIFALDAAKAANQALVAEIEARQQAERALQQINLTLEERVRERTEELERRNQELDQFAYVASHDLKSPLRGIQHLASWIREDAADVLPPLSQVHLAKLRGRVQRMEKLLDDLLLYSRTGRFRYPLERVDTEELVFSLAEWLIPPAGFRVLIATPLPTLLTERLPLEMVFRNLIGNAFKHHDRPQAGQVSIAAVEEQEFVRFSVSDNGPGISGEFHDRIFQAFQTLKSRDEVEGSGIGLALVKKMVEYRGGCIQLKSSIGQGATFHFTWPKTSTSSPVLPEPR